MSLTKNDLRASLDRARRHGKQVLAYTAAAAVVTSTSIASADFTGEYDPANWTSTTFDVNDMVDNSLGGSATNDGSTLVVTGPDDGSQAVFEYSIDVVSDGSLNFNWEYTNLLGDYGSYDYAGFLVNDNFTLLASNGDALNAGGIVSGTISGLQVEAGDTFAFAVASIDGSFGAGQLTISSFTVPEPSALGILAAGTIGGLLAGRRRKV